MRMRRSAKVLVASAAALAAVAGYEGYRGTAYDDGVGVWTIGYGTTRDVRPGQTTTPDRALQWMLRDLTEMERDMTNCLGDVPLHQHEWDAYVSLTYNIGSGAFCKSTLVKKLHERDYEEACKQILRWTYAGGRQLKGLVTRRASEYKTCMGSS